jgi:curved DNA-binding protein CbpA
MNIEHIGNYLRNIYFEKKKGQLSFQHKGIQKYLFFMNGDLIYAQTNQPQELLGEVLFKLGKLSEKDHDRIDEYIEPKKNLGESLIENNLISREDLKDGLIYQMREITLNIFSVFDGMFKFQAKDKFSEDTFDAKISIPVLIEDGIRRMKFDAHLKSFLGQELIYPGEKRFYFRLTEEEKEIFELIEEKISAEDLLNNFHFDEERFWKSLYLFYCLCLIDVSEESQTKKNKDGEKTSEQGEFQKQINDVLVFGQKISVLNYYQILEVSSDSSASEVKQAYFKLARKYHPDLFSRNLSTEIKNKIDDIFDKITKSYYTLSDDNKKQEYNKKLDSPKKGSKKDLEKRAEVKFRQGKTLYNQARYKEAQVLLEEAIRMNQNKGNYLLLLAMSQSRIRLYKRKAVENFKKAIKLQPWSPDAYFGLGMLYKNEGMPTLASNQFKKALNVDPDNKAALKELGIIDPKSKKKSLKDILSLDFFWQGKRKK